MAHDKNENGEDAQKNKKAYRKVDQQGMNFFKFSGLHTIKQMYYYLITQSVANYYKLRDR